MSNSLTKNQLRKINRDTWFIRTYCTKNQIENILEMDERIEWWRGIIHDKDTTEENKPKETHAHVIIKFKERIKGSTVFNLFETAKDEKGEYINTEVQECNSKTGSYNYLTHNTNKAKKEGKYLYSEDEIFGEGEIDLTEETNARYINLIQKIREGKSPYELVYKYGMLYITNIKNFKEIAKEQTIWEREQRIKNKVIKGMEELKIEDYNEIIESKIAKKILEQLQMEEVRSDDEHRSNKNPKKKEKGRKNDS